MKPARATKAPALHLHTLLVLLLLPLFGACASTSSLSVYGGQRLFQDDDVEGVDDQTALGVEALWDILPWGLGLEVGVNYSENDASGVLSGSPVDVEGTTVEGYVGVRKTFREEHHLRPYIGAGLSYAIANFEVEGSGIDFDDDDGSEGVYARAGLAYHFALFHVGVDYRYLTFSEAKFADEDVDLDNGLVSVFVGLSF